MAKDLISDLGEIISEFFRIILIIIMTYVAYQVLKAIAGGTWATENIIIAGIGIILAGMFVIVGFLISQASKIGKIEGQIENIIKTTFCIGVDLKNHLKKSK